MTHDELLNRIKEGQWVDRQEMMLRSNALRAVVERHKPIEGYEHLCGGCWFGDGMMAYPCPTIEDIEKELL